MREKQINQLYLREFFGSILLYLIVLFPITWIAKDMPDSMTRTILALTPMLPALGMLWAILRHFKRMDEYLRIWNLECIALAGALTAIFSLTYGFLEGVGFPRLSMFVIWGVFMGGWGIIACVRKSMEK
ncbi:hypothetical protein [Undibacterium sp. Ren11W]|uniref:hypothetical protein n=1 Tax=Undibacterium sp. Ren11W TaxID=3413045 RepID=UPI003BF441D4